MSNQFIGAYLGFKYGETHSSELGIVRTSNGNRFDENLFPTITDKALEIPGRDGKILQNTQYGTKNITVQFAFDAMTNENVQALKRLLGTKKIDKLVFDECPYKTWYAKITGSNTLKHLAFEEKGKRIYKGEGTINFICYDPFAHCACDINFKKLSEEYPEFEEWNPHYSQVAISNTSIVGINYGDMPADFIIYAKPNNSSIDIKLGDQQIQIGVFSLQSGDAKIGINTKIGLIEGYDKEGKKTGNIYDQYIISGNYFKIPVGDFKIEIKNPLSEVDFKMDYLYF